MLSTYNNKIIENLLNSFYVKITFKIPKRLGEKNHDTPFNVLKNWYLERTLAINWFKLTSYSIHLLEEEQFDEK